MNNELVMLYHYLLEHNELKNELIGVNEEKFLASDSMILSGFYLVKEIKGWMNKFDNIILFNDYIKGIRDKIFCVDSYLINKYNDINGYLIYDFLKVEYGTLLKELTNILQLGGK